MENPHSKISPTAKMAAYWKSLSDIPFSKEIAVALQAEQTTLQSLGDNINAMASFSPLILEARYKSIDAALMKSGAQHVMELACGLSPRGLQLAAAGIQYIGTDLPEILDESRPVINSIGWRQGLPMQHIHFQAANVLDKVQLENAAGHFHGKVFDICNEGLLMYLNVGEKKVMAANVHGLLKASGGCWITNDVLFSDIRKQLFAALTEGRKELYSSVLGNISEQVGRSITANDFADEAAAMSFYEAAGFDIEKIPFYDRSYPLSTLHLVPDRAQEWVLEILTQASTWILQPRP
ncbi:hypothetical protein [Chitinophaga sp.]|uniref:hypothetical protein n=1 Tax=Chitinophaga sp. TaxID=1869181 RepID=UPI002C18C5DB|nr:hypothetical protein [Chitinophaga sp.]HWV66927.1 hypothetical protein [Chitinophaga sp.]